MNPDPLLPVSGGVEPSHPVTRSDGDLTVRALVLEQGETRVAIVSAEEISLNLPGRGCTAEQPTRMTAT